MDLDKNQSEETVAPGGMAFRSYSGGVIKVDKDSREVHHKISDSTMDRMNDVVETDGWLLDNFKQNPVVLADHRYSVGSIIGTASDVVSRRSGLFATTKFDEEGLGAAAFGLVQRGLAKAWSVGFRSKDVHSINQGLKMKCRRCKQMKQQIIGEKDEDEVGFFWGHHFTKQELVEYSLVAVPANPSAVMGMIAKGELDADEASFLFARTVGDADAEEAAGVEVFEMVRRQGTAVSKLVDAMSQMADNQNEFFVDFSSKMTEAITAAVKTAATSHVATDDPDDKKSLETKDDVDDVEVSTDDPADEPEGGSGLDSDRSSDDSTGVVKGSTVERVDAMASVMQALRRSDKNSGIRSATRTLR